MSLTRLYSLYSMIKFFLVIPVKARIQWFLKLHWIPGLRCAAPGMTVIVKYGAKKNLIIELYISKLRRWFCGDNPLADTVQIRVP